VIAWVGSSLPWRYEEFMLSVVSRWLAREGADGSC
jgi:hypothetical protein